MSLKQQTAHSILEKYKHKVYKMKGNYCNSEIINNILKLYLEKDTKRCYC